MKISGQLQWTDYLKSSLLHLQPTGIMKILGFLFLAMLSCAAVGTIFYFYTEHLSFALLIPGALIPVLIVLYRYVLLPSQLKRIFHQQKELGMPFEMEFTEEGVVITNELGHGIRPWKNFTKWKENKEILILYHSDVLYTLLPKRLLSDLQLLDAIKTYLRNNKIPAAKPRVADGVVYILLVIAIGCILYLSVNR